MESAATIRMWASCRNGTRSYRRRRPTCLLRSTCPAQPTKRRPDCRTREAHARWPLSHQRLYRSGLVPAGDRSPAAWKGKQITLFLERVRQVFGQVWLDGRQANVHLFNGEPIVMPEDSLIAPHVPTVRNHPRARTTTGDTPTAAHGARSWHALGCARPIDALIEFFLVSRPRHDKNRTRTQNEFA